ncbi:MAG TPA: type II toxin-antitoxin system PemK/MazF family toxin [Verrucomicrobiae bacterium]|jgi:mRNA interferase MazF|nr:type II toxin-antitoxin system PemK/MazF family toxin [Verrucomicrobiae bacterium]
MAAHRRQTKAQSTWPRRGEIYLTALDPTLGHEIKKTRPALIIQNDVSNEHSLTTMVAPITSTVRTPLSPVHALLAADEITGLSVPSVALLNQIRTVDRRRFVKRLGIVDAQTMQQVDEAIRISFGLGW